MKLKQLFSRTGLLLLATPFIITSCDKDDDTPPVVTPTITETVVAGASFTLLEAAVVKAGYANLLGTTSNLTVFAPNDDAFRQLDITGDGVPDLDTEAKINALSGAGLDLLKAVLELPCVDGKGSIQCHYYGRYTICYICSNRYRT